MKKGFTFIELIIYIALVSLIMGSLVMFSWNLILGREKSRVQREVSSNINYASRRIMFEIRNANGIHNVGTSDLCLSNIDSARNPTRIYLSSGRLKIAWGGGTTNCTAMLNDQFITSSKVNVSSLSFTNRSSASDSGHIEFDITVSSGGVKKEWDKMLNVIGSAEMRVY